MNVWIAGGRLALSSWPWSILLAFALFAAQGDDPRQVAARHRAAAVAAQPAAATAVRVPPVSGPAPTKLTPPPTEAEAARFLAQSTFGPTLEDIDHVRQVGYGPWIDEQFAQPVSSQLRFFKASATGPDYDRAWRLDAWFVHAIGGQDPFDPGMVHSDQLRQRVAFALSEIFVVSDASSDLLGNAPQGMSDFYDTLARDAFGNYRTLLQDVTLHPVMGVFLSSLGNEKPDPSRNLRPDENYAREVLQLFSVGLLRLNPDGTPMRDNAGLTVPTYTQDTVKGFARVFTGWTFRTCAKYDDFHCYAYEATDPSWVTPMRSYADFHDSADAKQLLAYPGSTLRNGVLTAGGSATHDLKAALDNIFNHPNVGPFIGRQLIQRLVTSNPSPAYVARVAAAFANNGQGVRGDLKAVVRAVLLDSEARSAPQSPNFGKVREPLLRLTHLYRAMNARSPSGHTDEFYTLAGDLGQAPMMAPSVFNFFSPFYAPIGELTDAHLVSPELQLATDYMLPNTESYFGYRIYEVYKGSPNVDDHDIAIDLDRDTPVAADARALIDRYNLLFLSGQMSTRMRNILYKRIAGMPRYNAAQRRQRVQEALYLIVNSPEYIVQR